MPGLGEATVHELCNECDRVASGERVVISRYAKLVAKLDLMVCDRPTAVALVARLRQLPPMDPQRLRDDVDVIVDQRS